MTTRKIPTGTKESEAVEGLRFLAYLRTSTQDLQDPEESKRWQLARAKALVAGHGEIVVVAHDIGQSRSLPWKRRPQATAVLAEAAERKTRRFDAIVVAEPQRAFAGSEFANVFPILTHHGVELWIPELGGKVDPDSEAHDLAMMLFGGMSKAERNRIKIRTRTSMVAMASEGRFTGGKPPYGYRLVDAGPHPNFIKAREGKMLRRLELDPVTAPVVRRIFADYLAGKGLRALTDELTAEGVPSPSGHDPARYPHRQDSAGAWARSALRSILINPAYTGKRVFGRQKRQDVLVDPTDPSQGYVVRMRWTPVEEWTWPAENTHEPLVSPEDFAAVQERLISRRGGRGPREMKKGRKPYALRGIVICGACGRRMQGTAIEGYRYLRCALSGSDYARNEALEGTHPKSAYLREDHVLPAINGWLARISDPKRRDETAKALVAAAAEDPHDGVREAQADYWTAKVAEAETKLQSALRTMEQGGDPAVMARYINEAETDRRHAEEELARLCPAGDEPVTVDEVKALLVKLRRVAGRLNKADPEILAEAYRALGLRVTWEPRSPKVRVEIAPTGEVPGGGVSSSDGGGGGI